MAGSVPKRCEICFNEYKDPKVLPCFHILCKECVRELKVAAVAEIRCPVNRCGRTFQLENDDPETLPDAYPVTYNRDVAELKEAVEKKQAICSLCLQQKRVHHKATSFCDKCDYLCKKCVKTHQENKEDKYTNHEVISFLELSHSPDHYKIMRKTHAETIKSPANHPLKCKSHANQNVDKYCLECRGLICRLCRDKEHTNHECIPLERAAKRCREAIRDQLPNARLHHKKLSRAAKEVKEVRTRVEDQRTLLASSINHAYDRLMKTILQTKQDLHKMLNELADSKVRKLSSQQNTLDGLVNEFQRLNDFTEDSLEMSTVPELLTNSKFLQEKLDKFLKQASQVPTDPVEIANLALKNTVTPQIREICQKNLKIFMEQANPTTCTAEGMGVEKAETLKVAHFTVNVVDRNNKPCSSPQDVSVNVKCLQNDFSSWAEVTDAGPGKFNVVYRPEFRGEHNVYVYVNGRAIAGSPYSVMVSKPPLQLGKSLGTIPDLLGPRGVVITDDEGLLVCEWNGGKIVKLDKLARQVDSFGEGILSHPASIDQECDSGSIYVVDVAGVNSRLVKFSSNGLLITTVGKTGSGIGEFQNPRGVKLNPHNDSIYVCDRDNHRVQVFNSDLKYLRSIELQLIDESLKQPPKPNYLIFDSKGNIYITDYANHCILVFNQDEKYLTNFSAKDQGGLAGPEGITIDSNKLLYVTESSTHRVTVFKTDGEFVVRFGKVGRNEGDLKFPMGIAVNGNGSVYVCELLNNRIQVF